MRFCTLLLTFTMDSWLPFTNTVSRSKQLTYCVHCYCYPQGWKPRLQWQDKLKWLHLSVFFCFFLSIWIPRPCRMDRVFLLRVPLTTLFCTLSTHCLTWPPPNRSPSTAPSWLSGHPQGLGRAIRACVHWHILSEEGWEVWGVRRGHLVLLDQEALNHAGSSWKGPEGTRLGQLDSGRQAEQELGLLLTPSWWWAVHTYLCRGRPRQVGTLQAFSCTRKCCQPWLQICLALITSASGTLKTSLLIGCK